MSVRIPLYDRYFTEKERAVASSGEFTVSAFRYDSGVAALRLNNSRGGITVLPFQGQQVWRCDFDGRELTMRSTFDEPVNTTEYLATYGAFLLHCGATAVGVPSKEDTHPLHGELPNAPYKSAHIAFGSDEAGDYAEIGGLYNYKVAFNHNYTAEPSVRLYTGSAILNVEMRITNLKGTDMEVMYMEHINFRPVDGAVLEYSADYTPEAVAVNVNIPEHIKSSAPIGEFIEFLHKIKNDPVLHHKLTPDARFDPEAVFRIKYRADADGFAHSMQIHPDGSADYAAHDTAMFDQPIRWIARTPDHDAMGLVLPMNTGNGGYLHEKAEGNIKSVGTGECAVFRTKMGLLTPAEAKEMLKKINGITGRK